MIQKILSTMRISAKTDANQNEIVDALRSVGALVLSLAAIGKGCPDLLVSWNGVLVLMEIKDGSKPPSQRKLTPMEMNFFNKWSNSPVFVVESVDDAINILNSITPCQ